MAKKEERFEVTFKDGSWLKDELNNWKLESKEINQVYKLGIVYFFFFGFRAGNSSYIA